MMKRWLVLATAVVVGCAPNETPTPTQASPGSAATATPLVLVTKSHEDRLSAMGRLAQQRLQRVQRRANPTHWFHGIRPLNGGPCNDTADCEDEDSPWADPDVAVQLGSGQAETSIATDRTGQHIVIGYNDFRGFQLSPTSVSGVMYSDDGGKTFQDGGQLPSPGNDVIGGAKFPQIFGDPTVKYLGACTFVYGSILLKKLNSDPNDGNTVQTMSIHRSTDCGHTWQGPFEVTAATNPSGQIADGAPVDTADKEFLDVDPDTGRLIISWTNFSTVIEMRTAYSDDALAAAGPTWSAGAVVAATEVEGQGSMPAFAAHSHDAYVVWNRYPGLNLNAIGFSRSSDDGATWSAPINLGNAFFTTDLIVGNDRIHTFPSIAVDRSHGRNRGNIYVAYADNDNHDGADLAVSRSTDGGRTFLPPVFVNSRPGHDRSQWFASVSVDDLFGRVYVMFYDQGPGTSGDLMQTSYVFSDDGGATWSRPRPLTARPFHGGWGNDTSQPNLGDYIQGTALNGDLYASYAAAHPVGFTDGEPKTTSFGSPDVEFRKADLGWRFGGSATVQAGAPTVRDSGHDGNIDAGEVVTVDVPLTNYVTNPINAVTLHDVTAVATTTTAGVFVLPSLKVLPTIKPGATASFPVQLWLASDFKPGTPIELALQVVQGSPAGLATLLLTLPSGTPTTTTLLSESFDGAAPGALPAGWAAAHGGGANVVPWTTSSTFCGAHSNGAFHVNANDGPAGADGTPGDATRFERLFSPLFTVPADSGDVIVEMDVCYDAEDDPSFNVQAFDGLLVRVTDQTPGNLLRSVLAETFETEFTTGGADGYPKHFPRSTVSAYFPDMSAWSGDSQGWKHVRMRLPGMAGTRAQLRFEYTQDSGGICSDVRPGHDCGVMIDNVVVRSEKRGPRPAQR